MPFHVSYEEKRRLGRKGDYESLKKLADIFDKEGRPHESQRIREGFSYRVNGYMRRNKDGDLVKVKPYFRRHQWATGTETRGGRRRELIDRGL